ncbi:bifunctional adenosylcobinamide kinase/adenosylcobinamide-phosphate guanylyltransferase [Sulfurovum sp. ST-21]|uniref:Adenosylcobinamide kinase n=1 Tax=Sulfurovum indicum TaxID=2779528 RepID=A0A7M1S5E8_9BACT|nr:bifunctional adenosylcobinamide kinase/adenosylcobinamide-phosphate guanylyltransferase [Sulfurovum indicum]QOR62643.1 bifunctional adenosylcobinamide kinase/adenosylcobinamide-phosphate guanylyltransferase [Sulfurovum indicum]
MKVLYYGGQKSGKSRVAEQKALALAGSRKPCYIATYDNSYGDSEMAERITKHQLQRKESFTTIEESVRLDEVIKGDGTYLIDCMSMWILNTLHESEETISARINALAKLEANIVFVLNDVGSGVIPMDAQSRKYVDRSGTTGQRLAALCDEVYEVKLGLERRLK